MGQFHLVMPIVIPVVPIFKRTITIDHTKCGATDSSNFPVLVSISDTTLKSTSNGGHVANSNGYDIVFYSDSGYTTIMNWEMEFYDPVNGVVIAWVKVATVSHTIDTVFYVKYGDTSISSFQGGSTGSAWSSDYKGVWHYSNGTTLSTTDSTVNAGTGVNTSATAGTGKVDGGVVLGNPSSVKVPSSANYDSTTGTWSILINSSQSISSGNAKLVMARSGGVSGSVNGITLSIYNVGTSGHFVVQIYNATANIYSNTGTEGGQINDGNWHYLMFTFNGTSTATMYLDGVAIYSASPSTAWNFNGQTVDIGTTNDTFWGQFIGTIDEQRISNVVKSADWALTEWNNLNSPGNIGSPSFLTYGVETM